MMFHVVHLPNGRRLAVNIFEIVMLDEIHDEEHAPIIAITFRSGMQMTIIDKDRELLDEFLSREKGFNEYE